MPMTREIIDAILADVAAAWNVRRDYPANVIAHNRSREDSNLVADIERAGGVILDVVKIGVGTIMGGLAQRVHYRHPNGEERWAYIIPHRYDVDAFGEESLVCSAPIYDDPDALSAAIKAARADREAEFRVVLARIRDLDAKWSSVWPKDLGFGVAGLPDALQRKDWIAYAQQVRDEGLGAILTSTGGNHFERLEVRGAVAEGIAVDDTRAAKRARALIEIYTAAGVLQ